MKKTPLLDEGKVKFLQIKHETVRPIHKKEIV